MKCAQCGGTNEVNADNCVHCGAPLQAQQDQMLLGPAGDSAFLVGMGGRQTETHELGHRAIIGRLDSCDISVDDKSVSREHARLSKLRDGYVVEDLGSTNGTKVNGTKIHEAVLLRPGDVVAVGSVEFRYASGFVARALHATSTETSEPHTMVASIFGRLRREPQNQSDEIESKNEPDGPVGDEGHESAVAIDLPEVDLTFSPSDPAPKVMDEESMNSDTEGDSKFAGALASGVSQENPSAPLEEAAERASSAVETLTSLARMFSRQVSERESERDTLQQRLDAESASRVDEKRIRQAVEQVHSSAVSDEEIASIRSMLSELSQNPRDIDVLVRTGQNAAKLTALLDEVVDLREVIKGIRSALQSSGDEP